MERELETIFHLGFPKCASTFLQESVFPQLDLHYLPGPYPQLFTATDFNPALIPGWNEGEGKVRMLSWPSLASHELSDDYRQRLVDSLDAFGGAKRVLLILREQRKTLASWYTYATSTGLKTLNFRAYRSFAEEMAPHLLYHELLEASIERWGEQRVKVIPIESFFTKPERFIAELETFCGVPFRGNLQNHSSNASEKSWLPNQVWRLPNLGILVAERGLGALGLDVANASLWHRWAKVPYWKTKKVLNPLISFGNLDTSLPESVAEQWLPSFRECNRRVQERCDQDLRALGYDLGDPA